jgi:hypothetical protein
MGESSAVQKATYVATLKNPLKQFKNGIRLEKVLYSCLPRRRQKNGGDPTVGHRLRETIFWPGTSYQPQSLIVQQSLLL